MMKPLLLTLVLALVAQPDLLACSIGVVPHELDPREKEVDSTRPSKPVLELMNVTRGRGPVQSTGGMMSVSSCDDIGWVELRFSEPPRDERSSRADLGFIIETVEGSPALVPTGEGSGHGYRGGGATGEVITLHWIDGATDEQEPIDLTLTVTVVDLAGNRSEPSDPIRVQHPGRSGGE